MIKTEHDDHDQLEQINHRRAYRAAWPLQLPLTDRLKRRDEAQRGRCRRDDANPRLEVVAEDPKARRLAEAARPKWLGPLDQDDDAVEVEVRISDQRHLEDLQEDRRVDQ